MERDLGGNSARCDKVRPAKGRKEVIKRHFVGEINDRQCGAPPMLIPTEQVVISYGHVEEVSGSNAGG